MTDLLCKFCQENFGPGGEVVCFCGGEDFGNLVPMSSYDIAYFYGGKEKGFEGE